MKLEQSERFFIEGLFLNSMTTGRIDKSKIKSITRLTGDASTRRYYRVDTVDQGFVVCIDNPNTEEQENQFVTKQIFLKDQKVRVPLIFDFIPEKGYLLEEDLGNKTFLERLTLIGTLEEELKLYKSAIDLLISIQSIDIKTNNGSEIFHESFDLTKLMQEARFSTKHFFESFLNDVDTLREEIILKCFETICSRIDAKQRVLTHRDYHSRNLMLKDDELVVIDFQDARMGIPQYDLVSLLEDSYYQIDPHNKGLLIDYYFEKMKNNISDQTKEEFLELYKDMSLQRCFKAIGSFCFIWKTRGDFRYVKYIGYTIEKIRSIMLSDSRYDELRIALMKAYYAN